MQFFDEEDSAVPETFVDAPAAAASMVMGQRPSVAAAAAELPTSAERVLDPDSIISERNNALIRAVEGLIPPRLQNFSADSILPPVNLIGEIEEAAEIPSLVPRGEEEKVVPKEELQEEEVSPSKVSPSK